MSERVGDHNPGLVVVVVSIEYSVGNLGHCMSKCTLLVHVSRFFKQKKSHLSFHCVPECFMDSQALPLDWL